MRSQMFTPVSCMTLIPSIVMGQECGCSTSGSAGGFEGGYYSGGSVGAPGQLFPYDQQDPWLHGQHQRVPSYGGYRSFRPYNYRHVAPQAQIASSWGGSQGMTYSQQFFNKYRGAYLEGNLHAGNTMPRAVPTPMQSAVNQTSQPMRTQWATQPVSYPSSPRIQEQASPLLSNFQQQGQFQHTQAGELNPLAVSPASPPVHVYPESVKLLN